MQLNYSNIEKKFGIVYNYSKCKLFCMTICWVCIVRDIKYHLDYIDINGNTILKMLINTKILKLVAYENFGNIPPYL